MTYSDIKELRLKYKISQIKLAKAANMTPALISNYERSIQVPSAATLIELHNALTSIITDLSKGIDIRKKRIQHYDNLKKANVPMIRNADEYNKLLANRGALPNNEYRERLSNLYLEAQAPKSPTAPKALAFFSGCGGLSLGFAAAGFNLIGHVEIEPSANKIYEENFKTSKLLGTDICEITDEQAKQWKDASHGIDIIIGGPPCQGFSLAGKRDPSDVRNQLYKYYVHLVSILQPKVFVMENVRLLTSMKMKDGSLFINQIINDFATAGYDLSKQIVNAANYGVPQDRERIILVGIKKSLGEKFKFPTPEYTKLPTNIPGLVHPKKPCLTFRDATKDLAPLESGEISKDPLHWAIIHPQHVINWLKDIPEGHSAHENPNPNLRPPSGYNTTYKRIKWDEPASTISTNFNMISGSRNVHPTATRSLTIREATRAQSFPDEFIFTGKWGDIRKAIGNAVPPILAEKIALAIFNQYFRREDD